MKFNFKNGQASAVKYLDGLRKKEMHVLATNIKMFVTYCVCIIAFKVIVQPTLDYASLICYPHTRKIFGKLKTFVK